MLRKARDIHSLFYLALSPLLVYWQWRHGFDWLAYGLLLFLTLGVGVINHNHAHLRMWRSRLANRLTDIWIAILQGHPTYVFHCGHIANHHRYHHGERDLARTYRFGGDSNDLAGYLLHPFQAAIALYPEFLRWLARMRRHWPGVFRFCALQYLLIAALWLTLAIIDWRKWLLFVFIPQLHGWHWLLATNYLQHAHADGHSDIDYARNFGGWLNPLLFNIGIHTAHHENPRVHWSALPRLHEDYRQRVDARLAEPSLLAYMFRTYVLGLFLPRFRSRSLMSHPSLQIKSQTT